MEKFGYETARYNRENCKVGLCWKLRLKEAVGKDEMYAIL